MIGFRQFLLENTDSTKHVCTKNVDIDGISIYPGEVYYTNQEGHLHRAGGPALLSRDDNGLEWFKNGKRHRVDGPASTHDFFHDKWWVEGRQIDDNALDADKWALLKGSIPNNLEVLNLVGMNKKMQEFICKTRPDLIGEIERLDPGLKKIYVHEKNLSQVDI